MVCMPCLLNLLFARSAFCLAVLSVLKSLFKLSSFVWISRILSSMMASFFLSFSIVFSRRVFWWRFRVPLNKPTNPEFLIRKEFFVLICSHISFLCDIRGGSSEERASISAFVSFLSSRIFSSCFLILWLLTISLSDSDAFVLTISPSRMFRLFPSSFCNFISLYS